jgi:hypothetical protein|tara:strand:- start:1526 stop:1885 length:360 start_codon:yes stop_codon:yes gene_type:complete
MKEKLITFETAKLAKEKELKIGFINTVYNPSGKLIDLNDRQQEGFIPIQAPTQSLLQKWLREIHNIDIQIHSISGKYFVKIKYWDRSFHMTSSVEISGKTYEEALEKGLQEALKLIKLW